MLQQQNKPAHTGGTIIQFNLVGLMIFSICMLGAGAFFGRGWKSERSTASKISHDVLATASSLKATNLPPWGELVIQDIELEQPPEYLAFEIVTNLVPAWHFNNLTHQAAGELMLSCGLPSNEVQRALSPSLCQNCNSRLTVHPDNELIFSMTPEVRGKLYAQLAQLGGNHYMEYPFCYPGQSVDKCFADSDEADQAALARVRKLLYPRGEALCFSDFECVMRQLPTDEARLRVVKILSRQTAVRVGLRIRPDTDIDKLLGYWGTVPGVHLKDIRPLMESTKRIAPDGGTVSLLYLLPPFARQRLYTFPLPSSAGDAVMDCHWSTMNFFNDPPDNHFADATFTSQYIGANYYQVAKPGRYGDLIFILDIKGDAIHSGVYIADDVIFTKNGNNMAQPWMLMHLPDLLARYEIADHKPRLVVYRSKEH